MPMIRIDNQDLASRIGQTESGQTPNATYTIANLPTAAQGAVLGARATVSNGAASPTFLGALGTPATTKAPVWFNGTAWVYG